MYGMMYVVFCVWTHLYLCRGCVFDVSSGGDAFYGPDGSYSMLAGKDASRAFATYCFASHQLTYDLRGCTERHLQVCTAAKHNQNIYTYNMRICLFYLLVLRWVASFL